MANDITAVMYAILSRALPVLRETALGPQIAMQDYKAETAEKGDTIDVIVYPEASTYSITPSHSPLAPTDVTPTKLQMTLDNWEGSNFHATDKQMREIADKADFMPKMIETKVRAIANSINASILANYKKFYGFVGTAGTTPFSNATDRTAAKDGSLASATLTQQLCPGGNRFGLLDVNAVAEAMALPQFAHAEKRGNNRILEDASIGNQYDVNWLQETAVPSHTAGTLTGAPAVNGAHTAADKTIAVDTGAGEAINLLEGDIVTFSGHTQTYVVTADLTVGASSSGTLNIEPGLKAAVADNETITVKADHTANLVVHKNALVFASRLLETDTGNPTAVVTDPVTGIVMRMERIRQRKQTMWELDSLWGTTVFQREYGLRLAG